MGGVIGGDNLHLFDRIQLNGGCAPSRLAGTQVDVGIVGRPLNTGAGVDPDKDDAIIAAAAVHRVRTAGQGGSQEESIISIAAIKRVVAIKSIESVGTHAARESESIGQICACTCGLIPTRICCRWRRLRWLTIERCREYRQA